MTSSGRSDASSSATSADSGATGSSGSAVVRLAVDGRVGRPAGGFVVGRRHGLGALLTMPDRREHGVLRLVDRGDEVHTAADDAGDGDPLVPAQPAELVGLVDAEPLDPEAADAVAEDVHRQQPPAGRPEPLVDPEQHTAEGEVPQRLVQERRVERRARRRAGRQVLVVDLQRPREVGRPPEQLLVEVVAPPPDRLCERQARRHRVEALAEGDPAPVRDVRADQDAGEHAARDSEAPLPDLDDVAVVAVESLPVGEDVVQAGADDAGCHAPQPDGVGVLAGADPLLLETAPEQPHGGDDAEGDHQAIGVQRDRPDLEGAGRRARDARRRRRCELTVHGHESVTCRMKSIDSTEMTSRSKSCVATW